MKKMKSREKCEGRLLRNEEEAMKIDKQDPE